MTKQTYSNYFREYYKTESGHAVKKKAQKKYKHKISAMYGGICYDKARLLHREAIGKTKDIAGRTDDGQL